jgi:hypothetical protein
MGKIISVDEYDLLEFFGTIPAQCDAGLPWMYNDSAYEVTDGNTQMSFALVPSSKDVRILLKKGDSSLYELNAMSVDDVKLHDDKRCKSLEVIVSPRESIWLRLKPTIFITHSITDAK